MIAFILFALLALIGAIGAITLRNAVHAGLSLVGTLLSLAMIYVSLEAHFLASIQVIVYAGAIMVLFLFVIMMLNAAQSEERSNPVPWLAPVAIVVGIATAGLLTYTALTFSPPYELARSAAALDNGTPMAVGSVLFTRFLLPFEAVSILLLVAIIGAVSIVRRSEGTNPEGAHTEDAESAQQFRRS